MSLMKRKYQENIIHFGILYLFCFSFLIQHDLGCSDIQMVTRTPGRGKRLIKPFCPFATTATTGNCILSKFKKFFQKCFLLRSSCGRMGEGHKIPGFHRSSPASHLPHPTARFVPCCTFLLPPVTHFFNILARICATSQKFLFFQTAISRGSRSKNVAQWCLLSQHQPPQAKAKRPKNNTLQRC